MGEQCQGDAGCRTTRDWDQATSSHQWMDDPSRDPRSPSDKRQQEAEYSCDPVSIFLWCGPLLANIITLGCNHSDADLMWRTGREPVLGHLGSEGQPTPASSEGSVTPTRGVRPDTLWLKRLHNKTQRTWLSLRWVCSYPLLQLPAAPREAILGPSQHHFIPGITGGEAGQSG